MSLNAPHTMRGGAGLPPAMEMIYCIFLCIFYCASTSFMSGTNSATGNVFNFSPLKTFRALVHF